MPPLLSPYAMVVLPPFGKPIGSMVEAPKEIVPLIYGTSTMRKMESETSLAKQWVDIQNLDGCNCNHPSHSTIYPTLIGAQYRST
jgi:hypothetical protein